MAFVESCIRVLSGVLQVIFAICAVGLMIFGGLSCFMIYISNGPEVLRSELTIIPSAITAIFGLVLLIFIIIGCCGVCRQSICCMQTYSALLLILALAHLALGTYCAVSYTNPEHAFSIKLKIEDEFERMVERYSINPLSKDKVDMTQEWFQCCGSREPRLEYKNYRSEANLGQWGGRLPQEPDEMPNTCCERTYPCISRSDDFYNQPCGDEIGDSTIGINVVVGWTSLAVGAVELFAALLGVCLSCCIWTKSSGSWR